MNLNIKEFTTDNALNLTSITTLDNKTYKTKTEEDAKIETNKDVTITTNTSTEVTPDTGYDAMAKVTVTTNIPTEKTYTYFVDSNNSYCLTSEDTLNLSSLSVSDEFNCYLIGSASLVLAGYTAEQVGLSDSCLTEASKAIVIDVGEGTVEASIWGSEYTFDTTQTPGTATMKWILSEWRYS